jgi:hypothetical protein
MACLLKNEPASYALWQVKQLSLRSRSESESEQGVKLTAVDAKPRDLRMARMKGG